MSIIAERLQEARDKITNFQGWAWRFLQGYAPQGFRWVYSSGVSELQTASGEWFGRVRKHSVSGAVVRTVEGGEFDPVGWVAFCQGWAIPRAEREVLGAIEQDLASLQLVGDFRVEKEPFGLVRSSPRVPVVFGPLRHGINVLYGPGWRQAVAGLLDAAKAEGLAVRVGPEDPEGVGEFLRGCGGVSGGAVVFLPWLPSGNLYARAYWRGLASLLRPLLQPGVAVVLRVPERASVGPLCGVTEEHLKGDPVLLAQATLVACQGTRATECAVASLLFRDVEPVGSLAISDSSELRVRSREVRAAMAVSKSRSGKRKGQAGEVVPVASEGLGDGTGSEGSGPVPGPSQDTPEATPGGPGVEVPEGDGLAVDLFTVEGPTGSDSPQGAITPVPEPGGEHPLHDFEVVVGFRSTDEILERVWAILAKKGVVAFDAETLWVLTGQGQWVSAEKEIKHLRDLLYREIRWTDFLPGVRTGPRVPVRALLELADIMVLHPRAGLDMRPTAKAGRVVKISEMSPLVGKVVALDTETSGPGDDGALDPRKNFIELVQINDGVRTQLLTTRGCTSDEITEGFHRIFEHAELIVGHNLMFDLPTIYAKTRVQPKAVFDTLTAAVLLRVSEQKTYGGAVLKGLGLGHVAEKYLGVKISKEQQRSDWAGEWTVEQLDYAERDVQFLHALMEKQVALLNKLDSGTAPNVAGLRNRVARLEMAMILVMIQPAVFGIPVNRREIEREISEAHSREISTQEAFQKAYPGVANINSGEQVKRAFAADGVTLPDLTAETVAQYKWHPGVKLFAEYKEAVQVYRNLKRYREDVVFPNWNIIGSGPGRMASSGPGVQNVPKVIKSKFYAPHLTIVKADYPAIESRLAAVYTGEQGLIDAFNAGEDIHVLTASRVLGKPKEEVQKKERQLAKALNYGLLYGVGAQKFAIHANTDYGLEITVEEASEFREKFFDAYPALRRWHHETALALRSGKGTRCRTLFGRVMAQGEDDFTDALNYPIQGSGADLLKLAAVKVWQDLQQFGGRARILNLVHDEIVVAVEDPGIKAQVAVVIRDAMEGAAARLMPQVKTPVEVDIVEPTERLLV